MKFYRKDIGTYLPGIIWNPTTRRQWCSFDSGGGVVETDNPQLIECLIKLGFPHDEEIIETKEPEVKEPEVKVSKVEDSEEETTSIGPLKMDAIVQHEDEPSKFKTRSELNDHVKTKYGKSQRAMNRDELIIYASSEFDVELTDTNWMQLQKKVKDLEESSLEKS
jgi:hypothetical protein